MCGIFAYTGSKNAGPLLLKGLVSLEYRGYDSAGVFMPESGVVRAKGAVAELRKKIPKNFSGRSGIAHLRWATHGEPSEKNAHPHADCKGDIFVAHNGIIAQCKACPEKIVAARMGSPVVLGVGTRERFIASDPSPIIPHTKKVIFLEDGEAALITPRSHSIFKLDATRVKRATTRIDWSAKKVQKGGFEHFMLKEILEGPEVLENTLRGRLVAHKGMAKLGGLEAVAKKLRAIERIIIVACGTAYYAGLAGEYMLEEHAGIPVEVELGSEFRYRAPVLNQRTAVLAISQSGETADTLAAIREGKKRGALTLGIVNAVGS